LNGWKMGRELGSIILNFIFHIYFTLRPFALASVLHTECLRFSGWIFRMCFVVILSVLIRGEWKIIYRTLYGILSCYT
jgi:hypothetical protein